MNLKEIKDLINLMNENDITEIELEREGTKIKIKKATSEPLASSLRRPAHYQVESFPAAPPTAESPAGSAAASNRMEIASPMVGTFYRAPSPEAPPFTEVGQTVEIGQVVCIIEAMKLMNEIKSEVRGRLVKVAVDNAEPVEFGQTLFVLEVV
jgi:acetyl-CoA carboxylase biotin carboxyl carrier protein